MTETAGLDNQVKIVAFLEDYLDVNLQDISGNTLLHDAAREKKKWFIQKLLQKGADVNLENQYGATPLYFAALKPDYWDFLTSYSKNLSADSIIGAVNILLENKADPNKYKNTSPLAVAVDLGTTKVVATLLPVTIKKELIKAPWYVDMMFCAIEKQNRIELLTLLNDYGANFNTKSKNGNTLLNFAMHQLKTVMNAWRWLYSANSASAIEQFQQSFAILDYLLKNGADPSLANEAGETPLALFEKINFSSLKEEVMSLKVARLRANMIESQAKIKNESPTVDNIKPSGSCRMFPTELSVKRQETDGTSFNLSFK